MIVELSKQSKLHKLCLTLCDPMDCSSPDSSVRGISQVRILEWVAIFLSNGTSDPGIELLSLALQADSLPAELLRPLNMIEKALQVLADPRAEGPERGCDFIRASQEMAGQGWCQVQLTTTPRGLHRTWREGDFQRGPPATYDIHRWSVLEPGCHAAPAAHQ